MYCLVTLKMLKLSARGCVNKPVDSKSILDLSRPSGDDSGGLRGSLSACGNGIFDGERPIWVCGERRSLLIVALCQLK